MGKNIPGLDSAYHILFTVTLIILAIFLILCLIRAVIGPKVADRIVSVNMMGTITIVIIGILSLLLGEGYLVDICLIYAMISFLAVIVLCKVYMGVYLEKKEKEETYHKEKKEMKEENTEETEGYVVIKETEV